MFNSLSSDFFWERSTYIHAELHSHLLFGCVSVGVSFNKTFQLHWLQALSLSSLTGPQKSTSLSMNSSKALAFGLCCAYVCIAVRAQACMWVRTLACMCASANVWMSACVRCLHCSSALIACDSTSAGGSVVRWSDKHAMWLYIRKTLKHMHTSNLKYDLNIVFALQITPSHWSINSHTTATDFKLALKTDATDFVFYSDQFHTTFLQIFVKNACIKKALGP